MLDGIIDSVDMSFEQALRDGEGQGSLACCSPWGQRESDTVEQLNNNHVWVRVTRVNEKNRMPGYI